MSNIHSSCLISEGAVIGSNVTIGPFTVVHKNVVLGDNLTVGSYCELGVETSLGDGSPLVVGSNSLVRSHSIFYEASVFGENLVTGHHVIVREMTKAGKDFQIGTLSEIQGDCTIGDYVKFQSNIFVGKNTIIGNFVRIAPYVVLTNDPTPPSDTLSGCIIFDYASISASSIILPGVKIGENSLVGAGACVTKDVPPRMLVAGIPARVICDTTRIKLKDGTGRSAYPWTNHFRRGFPEDISGKWFLETGDDDAR
jgi:acetyltransferase-like isoleucine patch superfamily enzyme